MKDFKIAILLDFYGDMLTEKQKNVIDLYYNEDLSLAEIAEHQNITRQGVRDSIKRGEVFLYEIEQKLALCEKATEINDNLGKINSLAENLEKNNNFPKDVEDIITKIKKLSKKLI